MPTVVKKTEHKPSPVDVRNVLREEAENAAKTAGDLAVTIYRGAAPRASGKLTESLANHVGPTDHGSVARVGIDDTGSRVNGQVGPQIYNRFVTGGTGLYGPKHAPIVRGAVGTPGVFAGIERKINKGQHPNPWTDRAKDAADTPARAAIDAGAERVAERLRGHLPE